MNVYRIDYYNKQYEGFATVQADFTVSATYLLKKEGKLNAYIIKEVTLMGEVDSSQEKIINESYYPRENQDPVPPYKPLDDLKDLQKIFPEVNLLELGLTKRMIRGIRERIDFVNKKINVDRIIRHLKFDLDSSKNVRPNAYDGYMFCLCMYENIEEHPFSNPTLYLRYNGQNINLGIPVLNTIESSYVIMDLRLNKYTKKVPDKYGVFVLNKGSLYKEGKLKYIPISKSLFMSVEDASSWVNKIFLNKENSTSLHTNSVRTSCVLGEFINKMKELMFPYSVRQLTITESPYWNRVPENSWGIFHFNYVIFFIGKAKIRAKKFYFPSIYLRVPVFKGPIEKEIKIKFTFI